MAILKQKDTLIFDLGGVLIDWNPRYVFRQVFDDEAEMEHFLTHVCSPEWNEEQDGGRTLQEATEMLVPQFPHYEAEIRAYYGRWQEMLGGPIQDTVTLLDELRQAGTHRLYALTNWSAETWPTALRLFHFLHWFEGVLVSGQEHLKKPDPRIYQLILERYDIDPTRAFFIDDNARNVAAAQALGIESHHFQSPQALRAALMGA